MNVDLFFDRPPLRWAPLGALVYQVEGDRSPLPDLAAARASHVGQPVKISCFGQEGNVGDWVLRPSSSNDPD
jgi:hypothetical protein